MIYYIPDVLLGLLPILLYPQVVDQGRAAAVEEEVEHVHEEVLDDQEEDAAERLHQVVDQVELHGDHVPMLPPLLGGIAQAHHSVVLLVYEPDEQHMYNV